MSPFAGFPSGKVHLTPIPAPFFSDLLPEIDHLGELKVTLYALWFLDQQEGNIRYVTFQDFAGDSRLTAGLGATAPAAQAALKDALDRAVLRGTLLRALVEEKDAESAIYLLNSPRGRAALKALQQKEWTPGEQGHVDVTLDVERPNIFRLYEENIGPLTPLIAEALQEAERDFPVEWIEEAFQIAVENNVRRWRYIDKILRSWKEEGRHGSDRRDSKEDRRRYYEGEFADFIEH
jgi:DnaD/phage-associated family protein